jgi:hypothetical protein
MKYFAILIYYLLVKILEFQKKKSWNDHNFFKLLALSLDPFKLVSDILVSMLVTAVCPGTTIGGIFYASIFTY